MPSLLLGQGQKEDTQYRSPFQAPARSHREEVVDTYRGNPPPCLRPTRPKFLRAGLVTTFSNVTPFSIKHFDLKKLCALSLYALHVVGWLHVVVVVKGFRTETSRDFERLRA